MAEVLVSVSTGVMNSLLSKLENLMGEEYVKLTNVRKQLPFFQRELRALGALLRDLADMDGLSNQAKEWRDTVREMSYDIEDYLDDYVHRVGGPSDGKGLIGLFKKLMALHPLADQMQDLKARLEEISERHKRLNLYGPMSTATPVSVDPLITALYVETSRLVGIDGPKEEVTNLLTKVDDVSLQDLRMVSIVGFGGLGKTTLAGRVYHDLGTSFDCKAIVSVSQRPDMMILLTRLARQLMGEERAADTCEIQGLIHNIKKYLQDKRYFLVVDDLWDESAWDNIKCAFPEGHCGSRVLTTTRIESVAVASCNYKWDFVYKMKPLDGYNSRQLFFHRVFGPGDKCPEPFEELCDKILQICGGLPLAIITIASLLASQSTRSKEQWNYVLNSLNHNQWPNPSLSRLREIVKLSYTHLPHHLKTCLLYFGIFPEDHAIEKDELVMQWVAEGFVSGVGDRDAVNVAGGYFNELVNRSMIIHQEGGGYYKECSYKVHDIVLDLILKVSAEENFLFSVRNLQAISTRQQARRLSLQFDDTSPIESEARISLLHVRSLIVFGLPVGSLGLFELKFIRVLYISLRARNLDLTMIGNLFKLRYLNIRCNFGCEVQLPRKVFGLQSLETLMILCGRLSVVPQDIVHLPALSHLDFCGETAYPDGIGNMKSLHTLRFFDTDKESVANIRALGELPNLRVLGLHLDGRSFVTKETHMDAQLYSLEKLISCELRILTVLTAIGSMDYHDKWSSLCFPRSKLEQLTLYFLLPRMPAWIGQISTLSHLCIHVRELHKDDVAVLAGLPALVHLFLDVEHVAPGEAVTFSSDTVFQVLGEFRPPFVAEAGLTFQAGALPKVETLSFSLKADEVKRHGFKLAGIENLPNLKKVFIRANYDESKDRICHAAIKSVLDDHPSQHSIRIEFN